MIVRRAEAGDLPDLLSLAATFHRESSLNSWLPFSPAKVHKLIVDAISDPDWLPLVAYSNGELAGMALIVSMETFFGPAREAGDLAFYVDPARRGGRAAVAMLKAIIAWCAGKGIARLTIAPNTGIAHDSAVSFFRKAGMDVTGTALTRRLG